MFFLLAFLLASAWAQELTSLPVSADQQDNVAESSAYTAYWGGVYPGDKDGLGYGKARQYGGVYDNYGLSYGYGENEPYPKIIGRHGLAFEKRSSRASGLREPQTPESLSHIGYRPTRKEIKYVPLQAGYLL